MQRTDGSADAATAAAVAATVAPFLQLKRAAHKARSLGRFARAVELYERALAAAELALSRDSSLVIASLLCEQEATLRIAARTSATILATAERMKRPLFRSSFHVLHARWQAGTLFAPTAEETAYFVEDAFPRLPAQMCGACVYILVAEEKVAQILPSSSCTPEQAEAHLHAVYGALRVALETDARRMLERNTCTGQVWSASQAMEILNRSQIRVAQPCDSCTGRRGQRSARHARYLRPDGC
jgi:hypothetical protein